jgi:hypothetical protein
MVYRLAESQCRRIYKGRTLADMLLGVQGLPGVACPPLSFWQKQRSTGAPTQQENVVLLGKKRAGNVTDWGRKGGIGCCLVYIFCPQWNLLMQSCCFLNLPLSLLISEGESGYTPLGN